MGRPRSVVFPRQGVRFAGPKGQTARVSDDGAVAERESVYQGPGACGGMVSVNGLPLAGSGQRGLVSF